MDIWSVLTGSFVKSVGEAIDSVVTSDEERITLTNKLAKIEADSKIKAIELENEYQKEITSRWKSDNNSTVLAKNIRPAVLIYLVIILSAMAFSSGNIGEFKIDSAFVELFKLLAITSFTAYFGGRSLEKMTMYKGAPDV